MPYSLSTQQTIFEQLYCNVSVPNPALDRICLIKPDSSGLSNTSSKLDFINRELNQESGYQRLSPYLKIEGIDYVSEAITITGHGLSNGTKVYVLFESGASLGGILTPGTACYVVEASLNMLKLALTPGGAAINFSSMGGTVYVVASGSSLDANANRFTAPSTAVTIAASGGNLSYQGYFILRNATAMANQIMSSVSVTTGEIVLPQNHNLVNGDEVLFTLDSGASLPMGLSLNTIYPIRVTTSKAFVMYGNQTDRINNANKIIPSSVGAGNIRVKGVTGYVDNFEYYSNAIQVSDGFSRILRLNRSNRGV